MLCTSNTSIRNKVPGSGATFTTSVILLMHNESANWLDSSSQAQVFYAGSGYKGLSAADGLQAWFGGQSVVLNAPVGSKLAYYKSTNAGDQAYSNSMYTIPNNEPRTFEAYVLSQSGNTGDVLFEFGNVSNGTGGGTTASLNFTVRNNGTVILGGFVHTIGLNTWAYIRAEHTGTVQNFYINGSLVRTISVTSSGSTTNHSFTITNSAANTVISFDELRFTRGVALGAGMPTFPLTTTP